MRMYASEFYVLVAPHLTMASSNTIPNKFYIATWN